MQQKLESQYAQLLKTLKVRFENNMHRHKGVAWQEVEDKLAINKNVLQSVLQMEETGGEPDVTRLYVGTRDALVFADFSLQTPKGRRSVCYDQEALASRTKFPPKNSAKQLASQMGITLLNEEQYRALQMLEPLDSTTSSWIETPSKIRKLGGALFADNRFDTVFVYHNGADSYYSVRAFRGYVEL